MENVKKEGSDYWDGWKEYGLTEDKWNNGICSTRGNIGCIKAGAVRGSPGNDGASCWKGRKRGTCCTGCCR